MLIRLFFMNSVDGRKFKVRNLWKGSSCGVSQFWIHLSMLFRGRIFAVRKRRQTDRRAYIASRCAEGDDVHTFSMQEGWIRQQVGARSDTFWRKTHGVVKEERTFLEKSRKLDPSRIFFMASHGVSAHNTSWIERLVRTRRVQREGFRSSKGIVIFRALTFSWISFGQIWFAFGLFAKCFRLLSWHVFKK